MNGIISVIKGIESIKACFISCQTFAFGDPVGYLDCIAYINIAFAALSDYGFLANYSDTFHSHMNKYDNMCKQPTGRRS